jgi:hypothetical protein
LPRGATWKSMVACCSQPTTSGWRGPRDSVGPVGAVATQPPHTASATRIASTRAAPRRGGRYEVTRLAEANGRPCPTPSSQVVQDASRKNLPHLDERAAILVEAVGIEPTSGNPQPQASTPISGLSYDSLVPRSSSRQEGRGASLICLALPLRRSPGPATRI